MLDTSALYDYANKAGAEVLRAQLPENKSLIVGTGKGRYAIGIDKDLREGSPEHRTHLGHEVGHASTGSLYNVFAPMDVRQKHENQADKWTLEHLIPEEEMLEQIRQGRGQIWELAEHFCVTEEYIKKALCWYRYGSLETEYYFGS